MNYSVAKITTIADCDLLLDSAAKEKADLEFKKLAEERQTVQYGENSLEIDADLQSVDAEISATQTIVASLPVGKTREGQVKKLKKLEYQKFLLEGRKDNYGSIAFLMQEMTVARLTQQLTEIDNFIAEITARKAAI